jgi:hypothetical protein
MQAAADLAKKIAQGAVGAEGTFAKRDVYQRNWTGLGTPEAVEDALKVLEDTYWVRPASRDSGPLGGRPSDRWVVNPGVHRR